ncbi:aldo/keto reductase [Nocardiopsis sediminis]|uniref:Aldo/keto reductase n=1 Tax=Nocardiopsis sediminis TaxID=1778267 RepID=A0ABV8FLI7_9ACTN
MDIADMQISRLGFGAWAIGGDGWASTWGTTDDTDSVAAIHRAVGHGVNWIDTAAVYGLGHSEEVVARALAGLPAGERPYVFTKAGLLWDEEHPSAPPRRIIRPDTVRREVEASLRRLDVEAIDLYQVHWPDDGGAASGARTGVPAERVTPVEEYWQAMADLKAEGKVRAIGLSNHGPDLLDAAEAIAHVDAVQPPFSALDRSAAPDIAWAAKNGTAVLAYSPMQSGLLTGAFSRQRIATLAEDDWRRNSPDFTDHLDRNLEVAEALRTVAERHGTTVGSAAIAWALAWPGVTAAIVGARTPEQVDGWAGADRVTLSPEDIATVATVLKTTGAGKGPITP